MARLTRLLRLLRLAPATAYNPKANIPVELRTADGVYFLTANGRYFGTLS